MNPLRHPRSLLSLTTLCLLSLGAQSLLAAKSDDKPSGPSAEIEAATRLQIFLDRANFGPGKLDGRYGGFTQKALVLYRQAHDLPTQNSETSSKPAAEKPDAKLPLPDLKDLEKELAAVGPVFLEYQITEADLKTVGDLPKEVPAMAKLKWLPYANLPEAVAEKFHCDVDFLKELNPIHIEGLKAGDKLKVPNVEPFEIAAIKELPLLDQTHPLDSKEKAPAKKKDGEKAKAKKESDKDKSENNTAEPSEGALKPDQITVKVETADSMVHLFENGKLVAAYPVTIGSQQTESPQGEWKVKGIARLPDFRYDKSFLNTGERSKETYLLPPGPNNMVGVIWVALNKPGIGLHGTGDPDGVGRSASHGCIRLANWDIARLATHLRAGVEVSIH